MVMVFYRNFRKLLKSRSVLSCMFHSGFRENRWHCSRAKKAFLRNSSSATSPAKKPFTHLLYTNSENHVVKSSLDRSPSFSKSCRSCCTCIRYIHHWNTGLSDLLEKSLANHAGSLSQVAAVKGLHVLYC